VTNPEDHGEFFLKEKAGHTLLDAAETEIDTSETGITVALSLIFR